jgi:hypothetical protein
MSSLVRAVHVTDLLSRPLNKEFCGNGHVARVEKCLHMVHIIVALEAQKGIIFYT